MQQYIIPVNNEALVRAIEAVSGPEVKELTFRAYQAIDSAMKFAFDAGIASEASAHKMDVDAVSEQEAQQKFMVDAAYAEGQRQKAEDSWEAGYAKGLEDADTQDAFDDGYADGVHDARTQPEVADEYMAHLCAMDAAFDYEDLLLDEGFDDDLYHTWDPVAK